MIKLQTEVVMPIFESKLGYRNPFMMMGSCFATNIGDRLVRLKFPAAVNPFGVLFNPLSIANSIRLLLDAKEVTSSDLFCQDGLWSSYSHHSSFSDVNEARCLERINSSIASGSITLREASFLVITLGTSWAYRLKASGEVVANCHKTPSSEFTRFFIEPSDTVSSLKSSILAIRSVNPGLKVMLTVSPIRHTKDGLIENQRSKSALILACHQLCNELPAVSYFPSYEIMVDELRDYRFYGDDLVHPSSMAADIIFERFVKAVVSPESLEAMAEVETLIRAVEHIPFNPQSEGHLKFRSKMKMLAEKLEKKYSFLDLTSEIEYFEQ